MLTLVIALVGTAVAGDLTAQTPDGRAVILRGDGTWVFAPAPTPPQNAGFTVDVWGERLVLGAPAESLITKYSCTAREGISLPGVRAFYECKAPGGPIRLALTNEGTLLEVEVEGSGTMREKIRALDDTHTPRLGKPLSEEQDGADCPYSTSRYKVGTMLIEVIRSNGCYDDENPSYSIMYRQVLK